MNQHEWTTAATAFASAASGAYPRDVHADDDGVTFRIPGCSDAEYPYEYITYEMDQMGARIIHDPNA